MLLQIVHIAKSDAPLQYYALALLNGIIEDKRSRIKIFVSIHKTAIKANRLDIPEILYSFLI